MTRRLITLTAALLGSVATLAAASPTAAPAANEAAPQAQTQKPDQDKPAPFRVSVDVVAVDVQVIDRSGQPVPELGPEKFNVTINGRRRRVVSAERIASDAGSGTAPATAAAASMRGRVIVLAVDCNSFDSTATRGVIQATKDFVRKLTPDDFLGLSAYPNGAKVDPTRDHAAVLKALDTVSGQRDLAEVSQFNVRPSEMIDVTRELYSRGGGPRLDAIAARECGDPPDPFCRQRLITDVNGTALYYEGQGAASLGMLRSLIGEMSTFTGRKTLLLISGGMIASDTPGGRPDLSDFGIRIGKEAALANTAIYTLFVDGSFMERFSAQTRKGDKSLDNWNRDSELMARWLDQFTGTAGGALFNVQVGNAESALARIHSELSSVLPARRRAGRRGPRRPHARNLGEDDAPERHDPRPPLGDGAGEGWGARRCARQAERAGESGCAATECGAGRPRGAGRAAAPGAPGRCPGPGGCVRSRRLRQRAVVARQVHEPREHDHRLPPVGQPVAERSEADRGVRAGAGVRRSAERGGGGARGRRPAPGRVSRARSASRRAPIRSSAGGSSPNRRPSRASSCRRARCSSSRARCSAVRRRRGCTSRMRSSPSSSGCAAG